MPYFRYRLIQRNPQHARLLWLFGHHAMKVKDQQKTLPIIANNPGRSRANSSI